MKPAPPVIKIFLGVYSTGGPGPLEPSSVVLVVVVVVVVLLKLPRRDVAGLGDDMPLAWLGWAWLGWAGLESMSEVCHNV